MRQEDKEENVLVKSRGSCSRLFTVALMFLAGNVAAADLSRGLVAHYPFDRDASDASGNGRHATNHGATPVAEGNFGGAFSFDGVDDFVSIPASATGGLKQFTFALWVRTKQRDGKPRGQFWKNPTLIGMATPRPGSRDFGIITENGNAAYHHGLRSGRDTCFFSSVRVSDGRWHHVALTNDGSYVLLYVDGRMIRGEVVLANRTTAAAGSALQTASGESLTAASAFVGAANDTSQRGAAEHFYRGLIDDVRMWSRALSPKEIASIWTRATGQEVTVIEAPKRKPQTAGPVIASISLENRRGVRWVLDQRARGWALGTISLNNKPVEAPVRSGMLALRNIASHQTLWPAATKGERIDERTARFSGKQKIDGVAFSFEVDVALSPELPAAELNVRWAVDRQLDGWEVCLAYHEAFAHEWFCHLYPFAENAKAVARSPLSYVGVPAALLCREDMPMAVLFGIDISSDYLNPTTWMGTTGFHFTDQRTAPQFRVGGGRLLPGIRYSLPLQVFLSDAGNSVGAITSLVRAWIEMNDFKAAPLFVRTPDEALDIYLRGRRRTSMWNPGIGYKLQHGGSWPAVYIGTTPESAYFEYRIYEMTAEKLWRQRCFEQMATTLRAQQTDPASRHYGAIHTAYNLQRRAFDSHDRGRNRGYKPDLIAHMARYMLLTWQRVQRHEGIDRQDWYQAAVRAADWVVRQQNPDGGLPQKVDIQTGKKSNSVVSGRALPAMPIIHKVTGDRRYLDCAERMEQFVRRKVEGRFWFTGQHPDLPPNDYEADSIWGVIEYWLDKCERTREKECLERAVADAYLSLLWWCPKQLSWVKNPTQGAHAEQQHYLQYSNYCYQNRKLQCLHRLGKLTGDPLFSALYERVLQCIFWTQKTDGDVMGATYERICDPWRARGRSFNSLGTLYMNELSLDAMLQLVEMGVARPKK